MIGANVRPCWSSCAFTAPMVQTSLQRAGRRQPLRRQRLAWVWNHARCGTDGLPAPSVSCRLPTPASHGGEAGTLPARPNSLSESLPRSHTLATSQGQTAVTPVRPRLSPRRLSPPGRLRSIRPFQDGESARVGLRRPSGSIAIARSSCQRPARLARWPIPIALIRSEATDGKGTTGSCSMNGARQPPSVDRARWLDRFPLQVPNIGRVRVRERVLARHMGMHYLRSEVGTGARADRVRARAPLPLSTSTMAMQAVQRESRWVSLIGRNPAWDAEGVMRMHCPVRQRVNASHAPIAHIPRPCARPAIATSSAGQPVPGRLDAPPRVLRGSRARFASFHRARAHRLPSPNPTFRRCVGRCRRARPHQRRSWESPQPRPPGARCRTARSETARARGRPLRGARVL